MDMQLILEYFGYASSVVVAISLMMKNIRRLRWYNLIGAGTFALYGGLIGAWPVCILNGFIAIVDVIYLLQMNRHREIFDVMQVTPHESDYVKQFLKFYHDDIQIFFPGFKMDTDKTYSAAFCLRDARPVSLILLSKNNETQYRVELDYAIPEYRDNRTGKYFYYEGLRKLSLGKGNTVIAETTNTKHEAYLKSLGFKKTRKDGETVEYSMSVQ